MKLLGKYDDSHHSFSLIKLGQLFAMVSPPPHLQSLKNKVMIKLDKNTFQALDDSNLRLRNKGNIGPCVRVFIEAEV